MGRMNGCPALPIAGSPLKAYQRFLFWAAGAGRDFLEDCVEAEKFKYECIGALICLTATLATCSMFMAVSLTWSEEPRATVLAVPISLLWGALIFTIDRFMVSSLRAGAVWWRRLGQAAPRLLLAVIIGVIISRPIEMKIFEAEITKVIDNQIARDLDAFGDRIEGAEKRIDGLAAQRFEGSRRALQDQIDGLEQREGTLTASLARLQQELADLRREAHGELDGTGGSGNVGVGPIYRLKQADVHKHEELVQNASAELSHVRQRLDRSKDELEALERRIQDARTELAEERSDQLDELAEMQRRATVSGFLDRNIALHRLGKLPQFMPAFAAEGTGAEDQHQVESIVALTLWGITLLFITIEVLPILTKLMAPAGQYDEKMHSAPYAAQMMSLQELAAAARVRASFLEQYEHANSALYSELFESMREDVGKGANGHATALMGALWGHLRGGLDETLARLRGYQSPFAPGGAEAATANAPAGNAPENIALITERREDFRLPPRQGSRFGVRLLGSMIATIVTFFGLFFYCLHQLETSVPDALTWSAAMAGLASTLISAIPLQRSSIEK